MMKTVALIGQKGGGGKTTLALSLAVAAWQAGRRSLLLDLDPQASARRWGERRHWPAPQTRAVVPAGLLDNALKTALLDGCDFAVLDTPGNSGEAAIAAARAADLVLIPLRPQVLDIETLDAARQMLALAGKSLPPWSSQGQALAGTGGAPGAPVFVVLNGAHPKARQSLVEIAEIVRDQGFATAPAHCCHRSAYAWAPTLGLAPQELPHAAAVAAEIAALYTFTCQQLDMTNGEQDGKKQPRGTRQRRRQAAGA